jgi:2,3-bisphosphoglycerate-independent phosphoglycerate mutase
MLNEKKPIILVILDGYGLALPSKYNAITLAKKPNIDRLFDLYPETKLGATGVDVGLEENQMSGSESGHMNIGAGRVVLQESRIISNSIKSKSFFMSPALVGAINNVKKNKSQLHIMGLMGNGDSPHSNPEHFRALLQFAKKNELKNVYCHFFTDGRDSYPRSAYAHLQYFKNIIREEGVGKIATLCGRFYAMDRNRNWKRLTKAYDAIVFGRGERADSAEEAIMKTYSENLSDEYLLPTVIFERGKPIGKLSQNDSVIFFNLRSDRARQFTKLFVANNKSRIIEDDMLIIDKIKNLYFVAMTDFGPDLDVQTIFTREKLVATLPMALEKTSQLYIAESEKYAHITFFFNGGYADAVNSEDRFIIDSPKVDSYVKTPRMSADLITKKVLKEIRKNKYDFVAINYANADMVGHTGNLKATIKAIEALDEQISLLAKEVLKKQGTLIITADHGNAEDMFDESINEANTFHTKNPVPFLIVNDKIRKKRLARGGALGDIAPTILDLFEKEKPLEMKRNSLLQS